jgi:hypothetical protein
MVKKVLDVGRIKNKNSTDLPMPPSVFHVCPGKGNTILLWICLLTHDDENHLGATI